MLETMKNLLLAEYSVGQWILVFFLYSMAGWCWEVGIYLVRKRQFVNRGFLNGPILPIYGFGALSVLLFCVPVKENVFLVALVGTLVASVVEYVTGAVMEALFHVRYWDYSKRPLNLNGYICLLSVVTWAVFSSVIVCVIHPFFKPYVSRIPSTLAMAAAGAMTVFAVIDTVVSVRRALDLRALLESMERYAKELEALHGGLDSISERIGDMIRAFAARVDMKQEELSSKVEHITSARERVTQLMQDKRISLEEGAKERFANFERILAEVASYLPDTASLREEVNRAREKYDEESEALHAKRTSRFSSVEKILRRNPDAQSRRHTISFGMLRQAQENEAHHRREAREERRAQRGKRKKEKDA